MVMIGAYPQLQLHSLWGGAFEALKPQVATSGWAGPKVGMAKT